MDSFFHALFLGQPLWMWLGFAALVVVLLALDLGVLNRGSREIGVRKSLLLSTFYLALGLGSAAWSGRSSGQQPASST
jgi:tellurite resistance protein TerC